MSMFGVAGLLALFACNTPFIPIPPPAPTFTSVETPDGMGGTRRVWEARGGSATALASAKVFVFNVDLGAGVITRAGATGEYVAGPFDGKPEDRIEIRYETPGGERSEVKCWLLEEGRAHRPCP